MRSDFIYLKVEVPENATDCNKIREQGLFFEYISEILNLNRENITEIDKDNFKKEFDLFLKNQKLI